MHPLNVTLDESLHNSRPGPPARRRSSLDNSQLAAADTFRHILSADLQDDEYNTTGAGGQRRLSLNVKLQNANTTFLAEICGGSSSGRRAKVDLDEDFHNSVHSKSKSRPFTKGKNYVSDNSATEGSHSNVDESDKNVANVMEDMSSSDESSLESDADTFCDASVQEQANKDYIRKDLGASVYWNGDSVALDDLNDDDFGDEKVVVEMIAEDLEEGE